MNSEQTNPVIIPFSQIVTENGKTIRENNMELKHNIPIGTLVEVKFHKSIGKCEIYYHARLLVYKHERDCDGTPLYSLCECIYDDLRFPNDRIKDLFQGVHGGFSEESLKIVEENSESVYNIHKNELYT